MGRLIYNLLLVLGVAMLSSCHFQDQPIFLEYRHPGNVPEDAVLVKLAKGGVWQRCEIDKDSTAIRCQIYNWGGAVLNDEIFLPYDQGPPLSKRDLRIANHPSFPGPNWVCLANGRILIPKSRFEKIQHFLKSIEL